MLNIIYLAALAVFLLVMSVLTYYSSSWLASITDPRSVVTNYEYYSSASGNFLWISTAILLILANIILWKTRKVWAFWSTLLYFAVFIILHTFWLNASFVQYKKDNGLLAGGIYLSPLVGVILLIIVAVIVFLNQLLVLRMHDKMYAKETQVEPLTEDLPENSEENSQ